MNFTVTSKSTVAELFDREYANLRRIARKRMRRERADHTLQSTGLVHEAFLRLERARRINFDDTRHFLGITGRLMGEILMDHARGRHAKKRGAGINPIPLHEMDYASPAEADVAPLLAGLKKLKNLNPRLAELVHLRYRLGHSAAETAHLLGVQPSTFRVYKSRALRWLRKELEGSGL